MEAEPLVGGGIFADEGVGGGGAVVLVADGAPAGGFDGFELLGVGVEFDAGEGLDKGFELVGGKSRSAEMSQRRAVPSMLQVRRWVSSLVNLAPLTTPSCFSEGPSWLPVCASHSRVVLSSLQVRMRPPSWLNAAPRTGPSWRSGGPIWHDQVGGTIQAIEEFGFQAGTGGEAGEISEDAFGSGLEGGTEELLEDGLEEGGEVAVGGPTVGEEGVVVADGVDPEEGAQPGGDEATP